MSDSFALSNHFVLFVDCEFCGETFVLENLEDVHDCKRKVQGLTAPNQELLGLRPNSPIEVQKKELPEPIIYGDGVRIHRGL